MYPLPTDPSSGHGSKRMSATFLLDLTGATLVKKNVCGGSLGISKRCQWKNQKWPSMSMMEVTVHDRISLGFYEFNQTRYV